MYDKDKKMIVKFYENVEDKLLKFAVIIAKFNNKWVFCKHKLRDTYELPGGHRETDETIEQTARRELFEETGAIKYTLNPISAYSVLGEDGGIKTDEETFGMLYCAKIIELAEIPHSEIESVVLFDKLPESNWTYPIMHSALIKELLKKTEALEHRIFGIKENASYLDREGAYIIPIDNNKVGVVKTPRGYFLLGGGLNENESHEECIKRECLEETGCSVLVSKKLCSAETYTKHSRLGYFHPIQHYYLGGIIEKIKTPIEKDHTFLWLDINEAIENMHSKMQSWAIEQAIKLI